MNAIYITEQGAMIRKESQHLVVSKDKKRIMTIPLVNTERVLLFGRVHPTLEALDLLMQEGIEVACLTRNGRIRFKIINPEAKNHLLRLAQYERNLDDDYKLQIARAIVKGKINNARYVIQRYKRRYPDSDFDAELKVIEQQMQKADNAASTDSLMGIEGISTALYFKAFGRMFRKDFIFEKRTRRPPKDPVNAVLSFGYTLITNEIQSLLDAHGFDPYIGHLHGNVYGRPSLALDVVEEFRHPLIDRLALNLFNNDVLNKDDFRPVEGDGIYLSGDGLKKFLKSYETRLRERFTLKPEDEETSYRDIVLKQIQKLSKALKYRQAYVPYTQGD